MIQPSNVYRRLTFGGGMAFQLGAPLPGSVTKEVPEPPCVWLIVFEPAHVDAVRIMPESEEDTDPDREERWMVPAKYLVFMGNPDGTIPKDVVVHEIFADKVLIATRILEQNDAIDHIETAIREDLPPEETKKFEKRGELLAELLQSLVQSTPEVQPSNGQAQQATGA